MKKRKIKTINALSLALLLGVFAAGCSEAQIDSGNASTAPPANTPAASGTGAPASEASALDRSELFSDRDLGQTADLAGAASVRLESGKDVLLNKEGVYVLSGEASNVTVTVEAPEDAKVQLVLDGVRITNDDSPAIYVKAADKVFVTSTNSKNTMEVSGSYKADGDTKLDAVIFTRADLTLNGTGSLDIESAQGNGISSKDDLRITGGTYTIHSSADAMEANDAILIHDGTITIDSGKDALHSENEDDESLGYVYMRNDTLTITAADDAIRANRLVQIDGGTINIKTSEEGIEANYIQINGGQLSLYAKNDGINAAPKINSEVAIEVNGGTLDVKVGSGDTDAFDSNGNIYINGGTINVEAGSAFDSDGTAQLNGGTVTVNGETITQITPTRGGGGRGMRR